MKLQYSYSQKNYLSLYGSEIKATFVNPEPESNPIISRTLP